MSQVQTITYRITNVRSGVVLGDFEAADEAGALDAMARDAGYADYADLCSVTPLRDEGEIEVCHKPELWITLTNPWTGAVVERDVVDLTQDQLDAYTLDDDLCRDLHDDLAPCSPGEFLAAYVERVGPAAAGQVIIGS